MSYLFTWYRSTIGNCQGSIESFQHLSGTIDPGDAKIAPNAGSRRMAIFRALGLSDQRIHETRRATIDQSVIRKVVVPHEWCFPPEVVDPDGELHEPRGQRPGHKSEDYEKDHSGKLSAFLNGVLYSYSYS